MSTIHGTPLRDPKRNPKQGSEAPKELRRKLHQLFAQLRSAQSTPIAGAAAPVPAQGAAPRSPGLDATFGQLETSIDTMVTDSWVLGGSDPVPREYHWLSDADLEKTFEALAELRQRAVAANRPDLAEKVDALATKLLVQGNMRRNGPLLARAYFEQAPDATKKVLQDALSRFAADGVLDLSEVQKLGVLTDANGSRSKAEASFFSAAAGLGDRVATQEARKKLGLLSESPAAVPLTDLVGFEASERADLLKQGLEVFARENYAASGGDTVFATNNLLVEEGLFSSLPSHANTPRNQIRTAHDAVVMGRSGDYGSSADLNGRPRSDSVMGGSPDDVFDQVNAAVVMDSVLKAAKDAGVDLDSMLAHSSNDGVARIFTNTFEGSSNAFFFSGINAMFFGVDPANPTYRRSAADGDVVAHEAGHFMLHALSKLEYRGENSAIHEGFSDLTAAFIFNDPQISEAFLPQHAPLRTVDNTATTATHGRVGYDGSQVFSGYGWDVKQELAERLSSRDDDEAAKLMFGVLMRHAMYYNGDVGTLEDAAHNMRRAAAEELAGVLPPAELDDFLQEMTDLAIDRGMLPQGTSAALPPVAGVAEHINDLLASATAGGDTLGIGDTLDDAQELQTLLESSPPFAAIPPPPGSPPSTPPTPGAVLEIDEVVKMDEATRVSFRIRVPDPHNPGSTLPVEDDRLFVTIEDGQAVAGGTSLLTLSVPPALNIPPVPAPLNRPIVHTGAECATVWENLFTSNGWTLTDTDTRDLIEQLADPASNPDVEDVMYNGQRALKIRTSFGTFMRLPSGRVHMVGFGIVD